MTKDSLAELLLKRRDAGSKPLNRDDGRFVSLVIEGGAMRGVVSAGMVAALEQLNLLESFDAVYGASAGAINGAYFLAGQARYGTTIFYENINNKEFVDLRRLVYGQPAVSLEYLLDDVCVNQKPLIVDKVLQSSIPLRVIAANLESLKSETLADFNGASALFDALRASARIPLFAGPPVVIGGVRYLDASIFESIPFRTAIVDGATDVVILLTRPAGDLRSEPNFVDRHLVAPSLARINPELAVHYLDRAGKYRSEMETIRDAESVIGSPGMLLIQAPSTSKKVKPLETSRNKLVTGAMDGYKAVYHSLGLKAPEPVEVIMPFHRGARLF